MGNSCPRRYYILYRKEVIAVATNTGKDYRRGAVRDRSQVQNQNNGVWYKRGDDGRFIDGKADGKPFKGVRKED
jgi:hypothetical protein